MTFADGAPEVRTYVVVPNATPIDEIAAPPVLPRARDAAQARADARTADVAIGAAATGAGPGSVCVVGPDDATAHGDIDIRRRGVQMGVFGNPFEMRGEGERGAVVDAYAEMLVGAASATSIGRRMRLPAVNACSARIPLQRRLQALSRLAERVRAGEHLRLRCVCAPRRCHGDAIAAWVRARSVTPL